MTEPGPSEVDYIINALLIARCSLMIALTCVAAKNLAL
jgi:hypothetical protein